MDKNNFYVIAVVSNPVRFQSRYRLYKEFETRMKIAGANLLTVEMAFGDRPFEITESWNTKHVQVRSFHELWHKENLINIGLSRLPHNWEYVAWIDADVEFLRRDWIDETIHQLQHYQVVQMFQHALDLGPTGETLNCFSSFAYCHQKRMPYGAHGESEGEGEVGYGNKTIPWHPGFAWAARREAIDGVGGMLDRAILGAGDNHMAAAFIGKAEQTIHGGVHPNYRKMVLDWQTRAEKIVRKDLGYVPGTIVHHWHGKKRDRGYIDRWKVLVNNKFDPDKDIQKDWQGLLELVDDGTPRMVKMRDQLRDYFRSRNEDSVDLE